MKKMTFAFWLNLFFSAVELTGSFLTGSVAIFSDALHQQLYEVSNGRLQPLIIQDAHIQSLPPVL